MMKGSPLPSPSRPSSRRRPTRPGRLAPRALARAAPGRGRLAAGPLGHGRGVPAVAGSWRIVRAGRRHAGARQAQTPWLAPRSPLPALAGLVRTPPSAPAATSRPVCGSRLAMNRTNKGRRGQQFTFEQDENTIQRSRRCRRRPNRRRADLCRVKRMRRFCGLDLCPADQFTRQPC
jgi:hypothetical protein